MHRICPECQRPTSEEHCPHDGVLTVTVGLGAKGFVGQVISGRYRIEDLIGEGGFGAVYRAIHTGTGDVVAIKVLRNDQLSSPEMVQRFQQEAAVTAKLKQPHTVRVFDFGQMDSGELYIAMEFLDGRVLSKLLADESPLPYRRLAKIVGQVLKALAEAHEKGLVHRDLKPDNIFLQNVHGEGDFVKVLDFGIAKSLLGGESGAKTATGVIVGTPPYMSPEQARGTGVDARTDIYAMGCILYEALTNETAFPAETPMDTLIRRITEPPPRAHGRCLLPTPDLFCDLVAKAMATHPDNRYASVGDMAKALTEACEGPVTSAAFDPAAVGESTFRGHAVATVVGNARQPDHTVLTGASTMALSQSGQGATPAGMAASASQPAKPATSGTLLWVALGLCAVVAAAAAWWFLGRGAAASQAPAAAPEVVPPTAAPSPAVPSAPAVAPASAPAVPPVAGPTPAVAAPAAPAVAAPVAQPAADVPEPQKPAEPEALPATGKPKSATRTRRLDDSKPLLVE